MKTKRTGLDVLHQLHAAVGLVQTHPERVDEAAQSMTPEQLRKVHDGLAVLIHCIGPVAPMVATAAEKSRATTLVPATALSPSLSLSPAMPSAARPATRAEPATESS